MQATHRNRHLKYDLYGRVSVTSPAPPLLRSACRQMESKKMRHATAENSMEILSHRYSRSLLPLSMAAHEIGINLRTAHNQISKGIFPVPTILQARRRYVHVEDLAGYIDQLRRTGGAVKK